jgi:SAM-dependent methyltransferase
MRTYFESVPRVIDLGCGGGFTAALWMDGWAGGLWLGADISEAIDVAKERLGDFPGTAFIQADILDLPIKPDSFDVVFSEGVLHHTPSTRRALEAATRILQPGGEILFYVYRTKSPIREFTDDFVRKQVSSMSEEEAWSSLRPLTALGRALAEANATITLHEPIDLLKIPAGQHDVQRLIYWHFAKLFWNENYSFEENVHINFDWYRPTYSHRQSEAEVRSWCDELGLSIERCYLDEAGITIRARK